MPVDDAAVPVAVPEAVPEVPVGVAVALSYVSTEIWTSGMGDYVVEPEDDLAVAVVFEDPVAVAEWLEVEEGMAIHY